MNTAINVIVIEGKTIARSAELPLRADGAPARIKAVKGAKYLFTAGKDGAVNEHIIVKRSGKNLQVFLNENDDKPELIIEDYYGSQGELAGMGSDGQYHTFVNEGADADAFMMINDGAAAPLMMSSSTTSGLSGLTLANAAAGGLSTGWMVAGAIGGLLALGGIAAAAGGGGGKDNSAEPAPAPSAVNLDELTIMDRVGSQTGPVTPGGVTDDARPLFSGTGTPGSTIRIYDNGQLIGSAAIDGSGRWQWQPEGNLSAGAHDFSFAEMNRDGVEGDRSAGVGFELDLTAPARVSDLTLTDDVGYTQGLIREGDTTNDNTPTFSGRAEPGATVEIRDNGVLIGTALVGADGQWSFTPSPALANGEHAFSLVVVDPAGNKGLPVSYGPVIIDDGLVDKPQLGFIVDGNDQPVQPGGAVNTNPVRLGGQAEPGDIVTILRNGLPAGSVVVGDSGEWQFSLNVPEAEQGEQNIGLIVTSPAGEERGRSDDFSFDYDTVAPGKPALTDLTVTDDSGNALQADDATNAHDIIFSGRGQPGDIAYLWDGDQRIGSAVIDENGHWRIPVADLSEGEHHFRTEHQDPAGNLSEKSDSFDLIADFTAPVQLPVSITDQNGDTVASGDSLNTGELVFSGTGDAGDIVWLWEGDQRIGSVIIDASGNWSIPAEMTEEREYAFRTEIIDPAGNSSGKSAASDVTFDVTKPDQPSAPALSLRNGDAVTAPEINQSDITLSGRVEANAVVNIYNGNQPIGTAVADDQGNWSFDYTLTGETTYDFTTETVDKAGNVSDRSDEAAVKYDITPPDAVSISSAEKSDGSALSDGDYSNDKQPVFRGYGVPGDIVYLVNDATGETLGSARVDKYSNWEITPDAALGDDRYALRTDVADPAGNLTKGSDTFSLEIDATAPEPAQNVILEDGTPTLSGLAEAGSTVIIHIDGQDVASVIAGEDGSWRWIGDSNMSDGSYEFNVFVEDLAGNRSQPSSTLRYDVTTTVWDLNNGQQGWAAANDYLADTGHTNWNNGKFTAGTGAGFNFSGDVIYQTIELVAGQTYKFSFEAIATGSISVARLGIEIDGVLIDDKYTALRTSVQTISGEFVATTSGYVRIAIVNENSDYVGNDFVIDNLSLRASGEGNGGMESLMSATVNEVELQDYTIHLNDEISMFNLSDITDKVHHIQLEGHGENTLNISLGDVLSLGETDLFINEGSHQMMITGDAGDVVNLTDLLSDGSDVGDWNNAGDITVGGITYQVYQHSGLNADLLVQQNLTVNLENH